MGADPAQDSPQARLGLMLLSAVAWGLFSYDVLYFVVGQLASAHETLVPSAAAFWNSWWDMDDPASGVFMTCALAAATISFLFHLRWAGVLRQALPAGRLGLPILGAIAAALLVDQFAWNAVVLATDSAGFDDALLGEREDFGYTLTEAHLPGEFAWSVMAAPVFEEFVFRGLLLGCLLARGWNPWVAVSVVAAAFAAIHGQYFAPGLASVFISGFLFGWLRIISNGMAAPVIAHALMNGWVFVNDWQDLMVA